jgi:hypothetical protein
MKIDIVPLVSASDQLSVSTCQVSLEDLILGEHLARGKYKT